MYNQVTILIIYSALIHPLVDCIETLTQRGINSCSRLRTDGSVQHVACHSDNLFLLHNGFFNYTLEPKYSTCGQTMQGMPLREQHNTMGLPDITFCDQSDPSTSHPFEHTFDLKEGTGSNSVANMDTWWQSLSMDAKYRRQGLAPNQPTLPVDITLSFGHLYVLQGDIVLTFKTSRPQQMMIERSTDFGATWHPWQYFDKTCQAFWPQANIFSLDDIGRGDAISRVICTREYSDEMPYINGKVTFDVNNDRYGQYLGPNMNDYKTLYTDGLENGLSDFLAFTDVRIRLQKPATNGREYERDPQELIKFYYAISDIKISAGCFCNLHGRYCIKDKDSQVIKCQCTHNTEGINCEKCKPLYNNRPWKSGSYLPYPDGTANECTACECNNHSDSCTYDSLKGYGVCNNCQHNTMGDHCELCKPNHYHDVTVSLSDPNRCVACLCNPLGVTGSDLSCGGSHGQCNCKPLVTGIHCDQCVTGYYGLNITNDNPGTCKPCQCHVLGTIYGASDNTCQPINGQCPCKQYITGRQCNVCKENAYRFPTEQKSDCMLCHCDLGGSVNQSCDSQGQCTCKGGVGLKQCTSATSGHYAISLDGHRSQPIGGQCTPDTAPITETQSKHFTGRIFMHCREGERVLFKDIDGSKLNTKLTMQYYPVLRYSLEDQMAWGHLTVTIQNTGNSGADVTSYGKGVKDVCPDKINQQQIFDVSTLPPGVGMGYIFHKNLTLDIRCVYSVVLVVGSAKGPTKPITIDSIAFFPNHHLSEIYLQSDSSKQSEHQLCVNEIAALRTREKALQRSECTELVFSVSSEWHHGAVKCGCSALGTVDGVDCATLGGKCTCKPGVGGRDCSECVPGFYNMTNSGCTQCPTIPCPGDFKEIKMEAKDDGSEDSSVTIIIIIIVILVIILLLVIGFVVLLLLSPSTREKLFKNLPAGTKEAEGKEASTVTRSTSIQEPEVSFAGPIATKNVPSPGRHKRKLSDEIRFADSDKAKLISSESETSRPSSMIGDTSLSSKTDTIYTVSHNDSEPARVKDVRGQGHENIILDNMINREQGNLRPRSRARPKPRSRDVNDSEQSDLQPRSRSRPKPSSRDLNDSEQQAIAPKEFVEALKKPKEHHRRQGHSKDDLGQGRSKEERRERRERRRRERERNAKNPMYDSFTSGESLVLDGRKLKKFADFGEYNEDQGSLV